MSTYVDEFRGTDDLYAAEVLTDNNEVGEGYITGTVFKLAPVAEISKTVETASETKYYDNVPAFNIDAEGADTITLNIPALDLPTLAKITGKIYDNTKGAMYDGEGKPVYFALGYRLGLTDGTYRYVWRYKGSFQIPDETSQTKNAGTDSQGQQLTYTGVSTIHKFSSATDAQGNAMAQKALVVDERDMKADVSSFFSQVTTCDTLTAKTTYTLSITQDTGTVVTVTRNGVALADGATLYAGDVITISVTGGTITVNSTAYTSGNSMTVNANVAVVSTKSGS